MLQSIRKLPCRTERLFRETSVIPDFDYFNPSSAYPFIYVRATEKLESSKRTASLVQLSHVFLYSYHTDRMTMVDIPPGVLLSTYNYYQGIEDTRVLMYQGRLWFVSTSTHVSPSMRSEMLLGYFNEDTSHIERCEYIDLGIRPLKNMCPFLYRGALYLIDTYTLTVYLVEQEPTLHATVAFTLSPCRGLSRHTVRGSTSPVLLHGDLYGCVVHEHIPKASGGAFAYVSYWMEFDMGRCAVTFISPPFFITCLGIEFISGIEYNPQQGTVELYLGFKDKVPIVAYTTLYDLRVGGMGT